MGEGMGPSLKHIETGNLKVDGVPIDLIREPEVRLEVYKDPYVAIDQAYFKRDEVYIRTERGDAQLGTRHSGASDESVLVGALKKIISAGGDVRSREVQGASSMLVSREVCFKKFGPLLLGISKTEKGYRHETETRISLGRFGINRVLGISRDAE